MRMEKAYLEKKLTDSERQNLEYYRVKQLLPSPKEENKKKVIYFYNEDIRYYDLGSNHPFKPFRAKMAHSLIIEYELGYLMDILRARPATKLELTQFHYDIYIDFLSKVTPENMYERLDHLEQFNLGIDCPVFDGLFNYSSSIAGASIEAAARLNQKKADIAINWLGGQHNAKKNEASGCCYINDVVLAILELLRVNKRVLYINMDIHHSCAVEEAFYTTNRVMTVSFHKYGNIFPGTGHIDDIGLDNGKGYSINCPLKDGINNENYKNIFCNIISKVVKYYCPDCIVLQCGADCIAGDIFGGYNLTVKGQGECVKFIKNLNLPLLVLGGGGYSLKNVARTWAYNTAILNDKEIDDVLPIHEYINYYSPDYKLDTEPRHMTDLNTNEYLEEIKTKIYKNLELLKNNPIHYEIDKNFKKYEYVTNSNNNQIQTNNENKFKRSNETFIDPEKVYLRLNEIEYCESLSWCNCKSNNNNEV